MFRKLIAIIIVSQLTSGIVSASTSKVVCYYGTWAKYRSGLGAFPVSSVDTSLCTHIIYSFIGIATNGSVVTLDEWLDYSLDNLNAFTSYKSSNNKAKYMVAIGGWNEGSTKYSTVAASETLRAVFVESALEFVLKYNFDGLDLDWEYPAQRGGATSDKENFITLVKELKAAFEENGLLLTAAVAASASSVSLSYDIPSLSEYLDFINIMAYDLHAYWDGVTGHNAPLYASSIDTTSSALQLNVDAVITNWIAQGAAPEKLILGMPLYGRSFTLTDSSNVALGAPASVGGTAGPYTQEAGYLGYNEIVEKQLADDWTYVWDDEQKVPHIYLGDQWIGFDDPTSITLKVQYAQEKQLGGVMVWSIETDDFNGLSGVKNPLQEAIVAQIGSSSDSSDSSDSSEESETTNKKAAVTSATTTTTTTATTAKVAIAAASSNNVCITTGYVRDPDDCGVFYYCGTDTNGDITTAKFTCSSGLYYDLTTNNCNWSSDVDCS